MYVSYPSIVVFVMAAFCFSASHQQHHTRYNTHECPGECVWDADLTIPGNFSSLRSYQFRVTGVKYYDSRVALAQDNNQCCDMGESWIINTIKSLKTGENRENVLFYLFCDPRESDLFPATRLNFNFNNDRQLHIDASTALHLINCGISWSDVAQLASITSLKILKFDYVRFLERQADHHQMQNMFNSMTQVTLAKIQPANPHVISFVEDYTFPVLHTLDIEGPPTNHIAWENVAKYRMSNLQYLRLIEGNMSTLPQINFPKKPVQWSSLEAGLNTNRVDFTKLVNPELYNSHKQIIDWLRKVEFQFSVKKTTLLQTLDIRGNHISSIDTIQKDSNVEVLNLRQNRLPVLNKSVVQNLTKLSALDVGQNYFAKVDKHTFGKFLKEQGVTGLEMLHIDSAKLGSIDNLEWHDLRNLKYLDISNNTIGSLSFNASETTQFKDADRYR